MPKNLISFLLYFHDVRPIYSLYLEDVLHKRIVLDIQSIPIVIKIDCGFVFWYKKAFLCSDLSQAILTWDVHHSNGIFSLVLQEQNIAESLQETYCLWQKATSVKFENLWL